MGLKEYYKSIQPVIQACVAGKHVQVRGPGDGPNDWRDVLLGWAFDPWEGFEYRIPPDPFVYGGTVDKKPDVAIGRGE